MPDPLPAESEPKPDTFFGAALRWILALVIGLGGAYVVRRIVLHQRARALDRVVVTDWARFEGCLVGSPPPAHDELVPRVTALALGTGDELWPHTCSPHLTRLSNEVEDVAADDPSAKPLVDATNGMISSLGIAIWWLEHVQAGEHPDPAWLDSYVRLRREVLAYAQRRGITVPAPELPRHPRVPRPPDLAPPPPTPVALPGGDEADVVDRTATADELAVALRDVRSRYTLCSYAPGAPEPVAHCALLDIPIIADPRYAGFVQSDAGLDLAVWGRAPRSLRGLVDVRSRRVRLITEGNPDAARDYWVGADRAMALQINEAGPAVQIDEGVGTREVALSPSLDVIAESRELLGTPAGPVAVWLDHHNKDTTLRAQFLGRSADPPGPVRALAAFHEPQLSDIDRRLLACHVAGGASWLLAGDAHVAFLWTTAADGTLVRGPSLPRGINEHSRVACDEQGLSLINPGTAGVEAIACDRTTCSAPGVIPVEGEATFARTGGRLLIGDTTGDAHAPRVRIAQDTRVTSEAVWEVAPPTPTRTVAVIARGAAVAAYLVGAHSFVFVSRDGGEHFRAVPVTQ